MTCVQNGLDLDKPLVTEGYVVSEKGGKLKLQPVTLPAMTPTMVQVKVLMTGLCYTDVHMRDNDVGTTDYPIVLGHEGIAEVTHLGSAVRDLKVGDKVAVGWMRDSCRTCRWCQVGRENICEKGYQGLYLSTSSGKFGASPLQYNLHGGCFARYQRIEEKFAIKVPDNLPAEMACPLVCGGGTVFEPLCDFATPGSNVGVMGIGGLGTAAVKLARMRGCVVWALSGSPSKKEGVLAAGAHKFVNMKSDEDRKSAMGKLDLIIDTTPRNTNVVSELPLLSTNGTFCKVGLVPKVDNVMSVPWGMLVGFQRRIGGSIVCGTKRTIDMMNQVVENMDFMKDTDIWKTEHIPMEQVNEAMEQLESHTNKGYRYILHWE